MFPYSVVGAIGSSRLRPATGPYLAMLFLFAMISTCIAGYVDVFTTEPAGVGRKNWPVSSGVGLPRNANVLSVDDLRVSRDGIVIAAQFNPLSCWKARVDYEQNICMDNAPMRVVQCTFFDNFTAGERKVYRVHWHENSIGTPVGMPSDIITDSASGFEVDTSAFTALIDKNELSVLKQVTVNGQVVIGEGAAYILDDQGDEWSSVGGALTKAKVEVNGPFMALVYLQGYFFRNGNAFSNLTVFQEYRMRGDLLAGPDPGFVGPCDPEQVEYPQCYPLRSTSSMKFVTAQVDIRLQFYRGQSYVKLTHAFTNRGSLRGHFNDQGVMWEDPQTGTWALTMPLHLQGIGLKFTLGSALATVNRDFFTHSVALTDVSSSSDLHKYLTHRTDTYDEQQNFQYKVKKDTQVVESGKRCSGLFSFRSSATSGAGVTAVVEDFWQKYPSGIRLKDETLDFEAILFSGTLTIGTYEIRPVQFLPDAPAGEPNGLFQFPVNPAETNSFFPNPDDPHEASRTGLYGAGTRFVFAQKGARFKATTIGRVILDFAVPCSSLYTFSNVTIHLLHADIPGYRYEASGIYNIGPGARVLNTVFLSFDSQGKSQKASALLSDAMLTLMLLTPVSPTYLMETYAFGEVPTNNQRVNAATFPAASSGADATKEDMDWTWKRLRQKQASALISPAYQYNLPNDVIGGRTTYAASNIGILPGADPGRHQSEGRYWNFQYEASGYGQDSFYGQFAYGEIGWQLGYSTLHYDWDGSAGRCFLSTGDYSYFEWLHKGARYKSDIGMLHSEVATYESYGGLFSIFASLYEAHYSLSGWTIQPTGYTSHWWVEGMKFLYLLTGDRFALQSLDRAAGNNAVQSYAFEWNPGCIRCSSRIVRNLLCAYQALGKELYIGRAHLMMSEFYNQRQTAQGQITGGSELYHMYMVEALRIAWLENLYDGYSAQETIAGDSSKRLSDWFVNGLHMAGTGVGPRSAYFPWKSVGPSSTPMICASDIFYIAYNVTGDAEYLRLARQITRDYVAWQCQLGSARNADKLHDPSLRSTHNEWCYDGGTGAYAFGSQSKVVGWYLGQGVYGSYQEALLGGEVASLVDAAPAIGQITGIPNLVGRPVSLITVEVSSSMFAIHEVRLEWVQKDSATSDESMRVFILYDDGSSYLPGCPWNIANDNPSEPNKYIRIGPSYNERDPSSPYGMGRTSGDATAGDNVFSVLVVSGDGVVAAETTQVRIFVEDEMGNRAMKRFFVPKNEFDNAQQEFDQAQEGNVRTATGFCQLPFLLQTQLVPTLPPLVSPATPADSPSNESNEIVSTDQFGSDGYVVAFIVLGACILAMIAATVAFYFYRKRKTQRKRRGGSHSSQQRSRATSNRGSYRRGTTSGNSRSVSGRSSYSDRPTFSALSQPIVDDPQSTSYLMRPQRIY